MRARSFADLRPLRMTDEFGEFAASVQCNEGFCGDRRFWLRVSSTLSAECAERVGHPDGCGAEKGWVRPRFVVAR